MEIVTEEDLVAISPAGFAHLAMLSNYDYLAAIAEDTWIDDEKLAERVAVRIAGKGMAYHYSQTSARQSASEVIEYLRDRCERIHVSPTDPVFNDIDIVRRAVIGLHGQISTDIRSQRLRDPWNGADIKYKVGQRFPDVVDGIQHYGVFVIVDSGLTGLAHVSRFPDGRRTHDYKKGMKVTVEIVSIDTKNEKMALNIV
jgi:RecJ-like exonuclease